MGKSTRGKDGLTQTQRDFIDIAANKALNISEACKACNIDRKTYYNWLKTPKFKELMEECAENEKDWVESQMKLLMKGIPSVTEDKDGRKVFDGWKTPPHATMIIFWSKCKMKDRGYSEKDGVGDDRTVTIKHEFLDGKSDDVDLSL